MRKNVFIPDKISEEALAVLREGDRFDVEYRPGLPVAEKLEAAARAHAVIIRSATQVDAAFLEAAPSLQLVVRAGVGVDNVDIPAATRRGVVVQNIPDGNTRSAAEHTIALLLALARHVPQAQASLQAGQWERSKFVGVELRGKPIGVIGLGKIGRHVVDMAKGLGMSVLAFDPFVTPRLAEEIGVELVGDVTELARRVDFLTVHVPKSEKTVGLLGRELFAAAREGIRIINCARGGIVDEPALLEALESGRVAGAALDVFESEPPKSFDLIRHPRVVATPHLGASTREAQENVAIDAARLVVDFLTSGKLHSPINAPILDPELRERFGPYGELARRLGRLQAQLLEGQPERIVAKFYGKSFEPRVQSFLTSRMLEGFLEGRTEQPVNAVNSRVIAEDLGLAVEERSERPGTYFVDMVRLTVVDSAGEREVGGAIRGRAGLRVVSLDRYHFDAVLEGSIVIVANTDRPGMIGALGQALAAHSVNISSLSLGRDRSGGTALSLVNVDDPLPEAAIEALRAVDGILWAKSVTVS